MYKSIILHQKSPLIQLSRSYLFGPSFQSINTTLKQAMSFSSSNANNDRDSKPSPFPSHLNKEQINITQLCGTELPFSHPFNSLHPPPGSTFNCVCCGQVLFKGEDKFDSGTGWPSFTHPAKNEESGPSIKYVKDNSLLMERIEIKCSKCDAHLGHVFDDGPQNRGGQRYCINGLALTFKDQGDILK